MSMLRSVKGTFQKVMDLVICAFLSKACDYIIVSPVGSGKVSVEVARRRLRITFYRAADLVRTLTETRRENAHLAVSPLEKGRSDARRAGGRLIPESRSRAPLRSAFRAQRDTSYTRNQWSVRDLLSKRPCGTMPA